MGGFVQSAITAKPERLTLEAIGGTQWVLHAWQWDEEAPAKPGVTLVYQNGRFSGQSGCNNYFASAKMGDLPGEVFVGPIGSTKMGCAASDMAVETRFLEQLSGVKKFGFMAGRLALTYERDGVWGVMSFNQKRSETKTSLTPASATR